MKNSFDHRRARAVRNLLEVAMHSDRPVSDADLDEAGIRPEDRALIRSEVARLHALYAEGAAGPARERAAVIAQELTARGQVDRPVPADRAEIRATADSIRGRR